MCGRVLFKAIGVGSLLPVQRPRHVKKGLYGHSLPCIVSSCVFFVCVKGGSPITARERENCREREEKREREPMGAFVEMCVCVCVRTAVVM